MTVNWSKPAPPETDTRPAATHACPSIPEDSLESLATPKNKLQGMPQSPSNTLATTACGKQFDSQGVRAAALRTTLLIDLALASLRGPSNGTQGEAPEGLPSRGARNRNGTVKMTRRLAPSNSNAGKSKALSNQVQRSKFRALKIKGGGANKGKTRRLLSVDRLLSIACGSPMKRSCKTIRCSPLRMGFCKSVTRWMRPQWWESPTACGEKFLPVATTGPPVRFAPFF
jgi:hypothetical protein